MYAFNQSISNNKTAIQVNNLSFFYGVSRALENVNMSIFQNKVTSIIGLPGLNKESWRPIPHLYLISCLFFHQVSSVHLCGC